MSRLIPRSRADRMLREYVSNYAPTRARAENES
jgi:hypothetical protein